MRVWWNENTYSVMRYVHLIMLGYGHDESAPTPDGMFRGCLRNVRHAFRGRTLHYRKPFATFWQTTSSRRGPIHRARIYVFATTLHTV